MTAGGLFGPRPEPAKPDAGRKAPERPDATPKSAESPSTPADQPESPVTPSVASSAGQREPAAGQPELSVAPSADQSELPVAPAVGEPESPVTPAVASSADQSELPVAPAVGEPESPVTPAVASSAVQSELPVAPAASSPAASSPADQSESPSGAAALPPADEPEIPAASVRSEPSSPTVPSVSDIRSPAGSDRGNYRVLALEHRPETFSELIGQEAIARTLRNAIRKGRIWHAFLFAGSRGVGKTSTARILAKALNCHAAAGPTPEPCGTCVSCVEIRDSCSRDVQEIDGASTNSVEKVREIIEEAQYAPARDRFKVYLVDEVHMLSKGAFNALLKTLEDPPAHVKFIFATTEIHRLPETILSRCQEFEFRTVSQQQIEERLEHIVKEQGLSITGSARAQLARLGQGSVRDSLSALDQVLAEVEREVTLEDVNTALGVPDVSLCRKATEAIFKGDRRAVFEVVESLVRDGRDLRHFVTMLLHYLRDVVVCRVAPDDATLLEWADETEALRGFAGHFSEMDLLRSVDTLTRVEQSLSFAPEPRFHLEMALLRLVELPRLADFDALVERLDNPPPAPSRPSSPPAPAPPPGPAGGQQEAPPIAREYQARLGGEIVSVRPVRRSDRPDGAH